VKRQTGSRSSQFVGRRDELDALVAGLGGLRARGTKWFALSGEPGIGKTRLLSELSSRAEEQGRLVLVGRGTEMERNLPFGIWVHALDDHVESLGGPKLDALVGDQLRELAWVLPSASAGAHVVPQGLQDDRFRAYRAVRTLLARLSAPRSLVLVLDDVHWADDASLELIAHLLRRPPPGPILLALAFRTGQAPSSLLAELAAARRDGSLTDLELAALSPAEAGSLVGEDIPGPVRSALYRQSGGNPFYLEELARTASLPPAAATGEERVEGTPAAVAAALGQEINGLSPRARRLGWGAAVAGDPCALELAAAAAELSDADALLAVDELLGADLLRTTDVPRRYRFRHPIVRRAVYEAAGEAWRLQAHARVAAALADDPFAISVCAHHVERSAVAGDDAAVAVLTRAGHEAAANAPAVAARWLEAALRLLRPQSDDDAMRRLGLLAPLANALAASGRLERALAVLLQALPLIPPTLPELRIRLIGACASCENLLGRHAAAHARLLGALSEVGEAQSLEGASLRVELAADALYDGDFTAMQRWAEESAQTARALDEPGLLAVATALLCFAEYGLGRHQAAAAAGAESAALLDARADDEVALRLDAPYYLGFAEYFCQRYDDAIRHLQRGITVSRAVGQRQFVVHMMIGLGQALERRGRLREAAERAEAAVEAARLAGNRQEIAFALVTEAWTAAALGDVDRARVVGDEAVTLLDGLDDSILTSATHAHVGVMWLDVGETERCVDQLTALSRAGFPLIEPERRAWLYTVLARAELDRGNRGAAEAWVARAEAEGNGNRLPLTQAWILHARGLVELAGGDALAAAELGLRAAQHAESVSAPVPAARCRTLAGIALASAGRSDDAVQQLIRAESDLAAAGAARHRDEVAHELRRLGHRATARQRRGAQGEGLAALSGREREIVERVALGRTNREIAAELFLSAKTVEGYLTSVFAKLAVSSRAEVAEAVGRARTVRAESGQDPDARWLGQETVTSSG
jgi:DNA-binding CsgD family transcriptional regulator